jgi:AcrR family transcriptional regulator
MAQQSDRPLSARRRRLPAPERRSRILLGAMRVFAERGYADASMTEIARAGGVTAAVIYDHFASKQDLHGVLLEEQTDALLAYVGSALAGAALDPEQRMRAGVNAFFGFVQAHPFAWRLIFRDPPADPAIAAVHTRIHKRATQSMTVFLDTAAPDFRRGEVDREQTLEMFAQMLKMSLNGIAGWWYEHPSASREELVERVLDFCWRGLQQLASADATAVDARARGRDRIGMRDI